MIHTGITLSINNQARGFALKKYKKNQGRWGSTEQNNTTTELYDIGISENNIIVIKECFLLLNGVNREMYIITLSLWSFLDQTVPCSNVTNAEFICVC